MGRKFDFFVLVIFVAALILGFGCAKNPSSVIIVKETVIVIASSTASPTMTVTPSCSPDYTHTSLPTPTITNTLIVLIATFTHTFTMTSTDTETRTMTVTESSTNSPTYTETLTSTVTPTFTITRTPDVSLVTYYPFNGNADDGSGNANHGTVSGALLTEDRFGNPDSAYLFDGVDDYIISTKTTGQIGLAGDVSYTISVWFRQNGTGYAESYPFITGFGDVDSFAEATSLCYYSFGGSMAFLIAFYCDLWSSSIVNNQWYNITSVYDKTANTSTIYIDGQYNTGNVRGDGLPVSLKDCRITVGKSELGVPYIPINAAIDEVRYYTRPLSASEVQSLYNE